MGPPTALGSDKWMDHHILVPFGILAVLLKDYQYCFFDDSGDAGKYGLTDLLVAEVNWDIL